MLTQWHWHFADELAHRQWDLLPSGDVCMSTTDHRLLIFEVLPLSDSSHTVERDRNNWERQKRMTCQLSHLDAPGGCLLLSEILSVCALWIYMCDALLWYNNRIHWLIVNGSSFSLQRFIYWNSSCSALCQGFMQSNIKMLRYFKMHWGFSDNPNDLHF